MNDIIGVILIVILSSTALTALLTVLTYLLPTRIKKLEQIMVAQPRRTFLIGLVNGLFFGIIAAWLTDFGDFGGLLGALILLLLLGLTAVGLSSLVHLLRNRIYPREENGVKSTMKTTVLMIIGALTPVVGWFVFTPALLFIGLGAAITIVIRRPRKTAQMQEFN